MSKMSVTAQNAADWVTALLNLDISALQTTEVAQCRESVWELRQSQNQLTSDKIDQRWESVECLGYCIERLFNCLSEEAQTLIRQQLTLDKHTTIRVE